MAQTKQRREEILPGLTTTELQELLASVNQSAVEGAAHLVTVSEYAQRRKVNRERARNEIKVLMSIGKARFGGTKPQPTMSGRVNQSPAYEITP